MGELRLTVASWDDREDLVVELTVEDGNVIEDWGLVTYDAAAGKPVIDLYPRLDNGEWHFDLDEVTKILARAKKRIMEVAGPISPEQAGADLDAENTSVESALHDSAPEGTQAAWPEAYSSKD